MNALDELLIKLLMAKVDSCDYLLFDKEWGIEVLGKDTHTPRKRTMIRKKIYQQAIKAAKEKEI